MALRGAVPTLLAHVTITCALVIFAIGFFPYKPFLAGGASFESFEDASPTAHAPFDKVIFMVVDALRSDFVYSGQSGFAFLQSLIREGSALPFTAHASSPTITMPRIKAMTTGSIPSFLDVILNFAESDTSSSLNGQDTWLSQLRRKDDGNLVMFGDDTWLKLFPNFFARADGTTSFFVSDFTEVDNNVTRNIAFELDQRDWNGMILHYLGLDHIGHKSGSRSPNMRPKQSEMDTVISDIFRAIESSSHLASTLLVVCGDHGMNNGGNHGGAAEGETSPALVFASPKFKSISNGTACPTEPSNGDFGYYDTVEQSDIVPTLSGLLGFPVPLNNLGVFIPAMLSFWPPEQQVKLFLQNADQIGRLASRSAAPAFLDSAEGVRCTDDTAVADDLPCLWSRALLPHGTGADQQLDRLNRLHFFCQRAQSILSSAASNYDLRKLLAGIVLAAAATALALRNYLQQHSRSRPAHLWLTVSSLAFGAMMFSSSYVEEEHHFWYWLGSAWLGWLAVKQQRKEGSCQLISMTSMLAASMAFRALRRWNQTGQKHAGASDIARNLMPQHVVWLWLLVLATYADVVVRLSMHCFPGYHRVYAIISATTAGLLSLAFKAAFTIADAPELMQGIESWLLPWAQRFTLVAQARAFYTAIACISVVHLVFSRRILRGASKKHEGAVEAMHDLLTLLLITQSRTTNIPVFLLFQVVFAWLKVTKINLPEVPFTSLLFQYASFFILGGSNAISSIDLSNAYNGVDGYDVAAVGLLTFISNWAGAIWWASAARLLATAPRYRWGHDQTSQSFSGLTLFAHINVLAVMMACTAMRTHLFIWTVFSPKYLYTLAWYFGQHLCIDVGYSLLFNKFMNWVYEV